LTGTQRDFLLVVLPVAAGFCVSFFPQLLNDGDTNWHLAAGAWMIEHRQVPHTDPFSHSFAGQPWVPHEWLSELIMAAAFALSGWNGVMLLAAAGFATIIGSVAWETRLRLGPLGVLLAIACTASLIWPFLLARPHMLALPVLTLWTIGLLRARRRGAAPSLWLAPIMAVWANLHGSYVIGLVIAAAFGLEALIEAPKTGRLLVVRKWGAFGLLSGLMAIITPHGMAGVLYPFQVLGMTSLPFIDEWKSVDFSHFGSVEFALLAALGLGFFWGVKVPLVRLALLLLLLHMTLQHSRQALVLAVVGPLLLAEPFARATASPASKKLSRQQTAGLVAILSALLVGVASLQLHRPVVRHDAPAAPVTALSSVPEQVRGQPVFNDYPFGGWLILNDVSPFIDGRADMYGDALVSDYVAATRGDLQVFERLRVRYGLRWTILNTGSPLAAALDTVPGWRRVHADQTAVVHVFESP
jgi:hypothetical protein